MSVTYDKLIAKVDNGARFYSADLHVHSYGASVDVKDSSMTVEAIIDAAVKQKIGLIAITDHNTDASVARALDYGAKYAGRLLVVPGVEVTTANGHLLAYFPPDHPEEVRNLLAVIKIEGKLGTKESHSAMSMASVITEVERLGGIAIGAHIDRE